MSDPRDEISGGREPGRDRPPRRPLLPALSPLWSPSWSASEWMATHRRLVAVGAVVAAAALGSGLWAWQRAHPPPAAQALHVRVDPSEYFLPGVFDDKGQSDLLMLLHVDVTSAVPGPVRLVGLDGGGLSADASHDILGDSARFTVGTRLSCDQWAGGKGVRVRFRVGPGAGQQVDVPLDTGQNSPLGAQVTVPCLEFATSHPLRLTVFSVALEPSDPVVRTTWTVVNRSAVPITLADELGLGLYGVDPPLEPQAPTETTVLAPHGTATLFRNVAITSCMHPDALDPGRTTIYLTGTSARPATADDTLVQLALPDAFLTQLFSTARDVCLGAPDLSAAKVTLTLHRGPPGKGRAVLTVSGQVARPGPWTAQIRDLTSIDSDLDAPTGQVVQRLQGPASLALSAGWTVHTCNTVVTTPDQALVTLPVTVSGLRTYPYELPVTIVGRTSCTPGDVRN